MSLVISSDILAGVLGAAPAPASRRAVERLEKLAGVGASEALQSAANRQQRWEMSLDGAGKRLGSETPRLPMELPEAQKLACDAYRGFEGMMLRSMFEELLPAADGGSYGSGLSGTMWRSMVADNFASLYVTAGGIGISEMLAAKASPSKTPDPDASDRQWPYFRSTTITPHDTQS